MVAWDRRSLAGVETYRHSQPSVDTIYQTTTDRVLDMLMG